MRAVAYVGDGLYYVDSASKWFPRCGLGDRLAAVLSAVGATKERAQAAARAMGLADCGCAERQAWLNKIGRAHV